MNKQGIIKSVRTLFPTRWHSATRFGVHLVKFASRNELFNRVNQILISIILVSFCGINRINKISSFTGDGLTRVLLKLNKSINGKAISTTLKKPGQRGARRLQSLLLLTNARWLKESIERVFFRADSRFFSGELFDLLESYGWEYLVKVKLENLEKLLQSKTWEPIRGKEDVAICAFTYKAHGWSKSRTLKAIRSVKEPACPVGRYLEVE